MKELMKSLQKFSRKKSQLFCGEISLDQFLEKFLMDLKEFCKGIPEKQNWSPAPFEIFWKNTWRIP